MARHTDFIQPFQLESSAIRGRFVRLGPTVDSILQKHDYPATVSKFLSELLIIGAAMADTFKFTGNFIIQIQSRGPISLMVAHTDSNGDMRGYANFDAKRIEEIDTFLAKSPEANSNAVQDYFGDGTFTFTLDQGPQMDLYQGVVKLEGAHLYECVEHYFAQSEQLPITFSVTSENQVCDNGNPCWYAAGIMLQRMPAPTNESEEAEEDAWVRAKLLLGTATTEELLNAFLSPNDLLYRLFHEDGVRVFDPTVVNARCSCSKERIEAFLIGCTEEDFKDISKDGTIEVRCHFCNHTYVFNEKETLQLPAKRKARRETNN